MAKEISNLKQYKNAINRRSFGFVFSLKMPVQGKDVKRITVYKE
jgi:hypothetical protein